MGRGLVLTLLLLTGSAWAALPGVTEFKTPPERIADAELAPLLDKRIAAADVVALGETVHASSGFLKIQTRLIRYLVEKHGLRLLIWENPPLRSLELARWVSSCTTSKSAPPVDVLYLPTPSDVPLFDWICDFNLARPRDAIAFRGMDVWDRPWEHYARVRTLSPAVGIAPRLLAAVEKLCPAYRSTSWSDIEVILAQVQTDRRFLPGESYETCRAALGSIFEAARRRGLDTQKKDPAASDAFELAISASTLLGWLGFYNYNWSDDVLSWNARDEAQGRNTMLIMEKHEAKRAIVAAHTSHVSHNRSPADWWGFGDIKSGIHFFEAMTRKRVFNIAFTAYEASGAQGQWAIPTASNSLDRKLHDAGHVFAFFASDAAFLSQHKRWWMQNQNAGNYENGVELVPRDHFDAFFFLDRSHLDRALPARPMWEP